MTNWTRKLSKSEIFMLMVHKQFQKFQVAYSLNISSNVNISEAVFKEALNCLFKKVPIFRLAVQPRDGEMWFYEIDETLIDFKVETDCTEEEMYDRLIAHNYNFESGPLWCSRLIKHTSSSPFKYSMLFGFAHCITDGSSNARILSELLSILNKLLKDETVDVSQIGEHVSEKELSILIDNKKITEVTSESILSYFGWEKCPTLYTDVFPRPNITNIMTVKSLNMMHIFDRQQTLSIMEKCKLHKVSVHCALTSAIHSAILGIYEEKTKTKKRKYEILTDHVVDGRRYITEEFPKFGPLIHPMPVISQHDMENDIWENAKSFAPVLKHHLILENNIGRKMMSLFHNLPTPTELLLSDEGVSIREIIRGDSHVSNMGSLDKIFSTKNDIVRIETLKRGTGGMDQISHLFHTLNDRLSYQLDYSAFHNKDLIDILFKDIIERIGLAAK